MRFEEVCVEALGYELPRRAITSSAIEQALAPLHGRLGISNGWLEALTGIRERRFWDVGVKPSEVATLAARDALDKAGLTPGEVDLLVSSSVCRDYVEPSVAALVHGNLGMRSTAMNFDVGNACLGFVTAMSVVADLVESGRIKRGLVVAGEGSRRVTEATIERLLRPDATATTYRENLATLTLGSGAVAMLLSHRSVSGSPHRFRGGLLRGATQHNRLCVGTETSMTTDPPKLLAEGVALARRTWDEACERWGWAAGDFQHFALHQVGKANHETLLRTLSLPDGLALRVYPFLGNVGAAGVPLTLALAVERGLLTEGHSAALMGIGSGLNVAMMQVDW